MQESVLPNLKSVVLLMLGEASWFVLLERTGKIWATLILLLQGGDAAGQKVLKGNLQLGDDV